MIEARANFNKDQAFRFWAASHGGLYAPVTDKTFPNPYLSHIKDRDIRKNTGEILTLMNPAYIMRQLNEDYSKLYGIPGHITSLNPLRPENKPDEWEVSALQDFKKGKKEVSSFTKINDKPYLRLMKPMFVEESCLKCHKKQGYHVGDIRGGVSVSIPLSTHIDIYKNTMYSSICTHLILYIFGIGGIILWSRRIKKDVIRQQKTEEALIESETRFRSVIDNAADAFFLAQLDGKIIDVNQSSCRSLGYTRDELLSMNLSDIDVTVITERHKENFWDKMLLGSSVTIDGIHRRKDGVCFPVEVRADTLEINGKKYMLGLARDISERKETEKALRESEAKNRAILGALPDNMFIFSKDGELLEYYSTNKEDLFVNPQDFLRKNIRQMLPADVAVKCMGKIEETLETGEIQMFEYQLKFPERGTETFEARMVIKNENEILVSIRNITDRKLVEEKLHWELSLNKALTDVSEALISGQFSINEFAGILLKNARKITKSEQGLVSKLAPDRKDNICYACTDLFAKEFQVKYRDLKIIYDIDLNERYKKFWEYLNASEAFFTNLPSEHPAFRSVPDFGHKLNNYLFIPALLGEEKYALISLSNSEVNYTEQDLEAVKRLTDIFLMGIVQIRNQKAVKDSLREKEILLKEIHHRVKNNMQIIYSLLNMKLIKLKDENVKEILKDSLGKIHSMALIHERLYKSQDLSKVNFDEYIKSLAAEMILMYNIDENKIEFTIEADEIFLSIDKAIPCGLVINELITNSIKHAFPAEWNSKGEININMKHNEGKLQIKFSDNGSGIPEDITLKSADTIGFGIIHMTIEKQLMGKIVLDRTSGTTFLIEIPLDKT